MPCSPPDPGDTDLQQNQERSTNITQTDSMNERIEEATDGIDEKRRETGTQEEHISYNNKTATDLLETLILKRAGYKPTRIATEVGHAKARRRVLSDPRTRYRSIFIRWPHDVSSRQLVTIGSPDYLPGKMAPNKIRLWGASLFHFYYLREHTYWAPRPRLRATTASKMLQWVALAGELAGEEYAGAKCWVELAKREEDPEIIEPCDIARLITAGEAKQRDMIVRTRPGGSDDEATKVEDEVLFPRLYPIKSVFAADTYPTGWIRAPFVDSPTNSITQPLRLQQYIPQHLLPQKLVVHDPYSILHVPETHHHQKTEIIHTYKLQPSLMSSDRREADQAATVQQEAQAKAILDHFLLDPHTRNAAPPGYILRPPCSKDDAQPGLVRPYIFLVLPPVPPRIPAMEGHLYIDRDHCIGKGHHSIVYNAEWELPRNFLVPLEICKQCIGQDLLEQLQTIYNTDGSSIDPEFKEEIGRLVVKTSATEPVIYSPGDSESKYVLDEGRLDSGLVYEGPLRVLHSRVQYHNPEEGPYCEHRRKTAIHPLTTKVHVAAKLSIRKDDHLAHEADNYQRFPKHFFEHWSGFNIVPPMDEPVPIAPIVPQFYGYYVLDEDKEAGHGSPISDERLHLSPILLLEHCGQPIKPDTLSADDKSECASLVYRFNEAKWDHGFSYQRTILEQNGPLSNWPSERTKSSFRLINFRRSVCAPDIKPDEDDDEDLAMDNFYTTCDWFKCWV